MSRALLNRAKKATIFIVVLFASMTTLDYAVGVSSGAMDFASQRISDSTALAQQIGPIQHVKLRKFWGFQRESGFAGDRIELALEVSGSLRTIPLIVRIDQRDDTYKVVWSSEPL